MKLALGTAQFGLNYGIANQQGKISFDKAQSILKYALENGLSTLDTAIAYGDSEQRLGQIGVQDWQVISKLSAKPVDCGNIADWVSDELNKSRNNLKIENHYGLLLHRPLELLAKGGGKLYQALQQVKQEGLVRKIGISIYDPTELDRLCSRYKFDLVQAPFNIFDRRIQVSGWIKRLYDQGTELHVRSAFLQGLLLMEPADRPEKFERWRPLWTSYDDWLKLSGLTALQACLNYPLSFMEISKVIVGVDSLNQLRDIVQATQVSVPPLPESIATQDLELIDPARWVASG